MFAVLFILYFMEVFYELFSRFIQDFEKLCMETVIYHAIYYRPPFLTKQNRIVFRNLGS